MFWPKREYLMVSGVLYQEVSNFLVVSLRAEVFIIYIPWFTDIRRKNVQN